MEGGGCREWGVMQCKPSLVDVREVSAGQELSTRLLGAPPPPTRSAAEDMAETNSHARVQRVCGRDSGQKKKEGKKGGRRGKEEKKKNLLPATEGPAHMAGPFPTDVFRLCSRSLALSHSAWWVEGGTEGGGRKVIHDVSLLLVTVRLASKHGPDTVCIRSIITRQGSNSR